MCHITFLKVCANINSNSYLLLLVIPSVVLLVSKMYRCFLKACLHQQERVTLKLKELCFLFSFYKDIYLFERVATEEEKQSEKVISSICWFTLQIGHNSQDWTRPKPWKLELHPDRPCGWQWLKQLGHSFSLCRFVNRKLSWK